MKLEGKVAVVTGAASGIGKAIAILYAKEGAKVVVSDINQDGAKETVAEIEKNGGSAIAVLTDVAKEEDIQKLIDTTVSTYGTVDILVNNAGIMDNMAPAADITDELWERVLAVNTTGVMRTTRKVLPIFLAKGSGVIINVVSIAGLHGCIAGATYTASKYAVVGFTKNTAFMYAKEGIRCNAIAPGAVVTNIASSMGNVNQFGSARSGAGMVLNPRSAQPEEIANVAVFLASNDASFVNGAIVVADGGWTAYMQGNEGMAYLLEIETSMDAHDTGISSVVYQCTYEDLKQKGDYRPIQLGSYDSVPMRKKSHLLGKAKVTVSRLFAVYLKELKRPLYDFVTCKRVYKAINSEQVQTSPKQLPVFRSSRRFATHFGLGIDQEKDTYYQSSYFPMQQEYV